jgi:peptidoglycan/xylan/chitin deacetylase (PgdA/CDA1 family)
VAITFDDGFLDNYSVAWPILRQHGFTATIFLAAAYLGATSIWRDGSLGQTPLLSADQVLEMAGEGIRFGSHTMSHARLTDLADTAAVTRELAGSKAALGDLLQHAVIGFCYPYSGLNNAVKRQVAQAGYQFALTYAPAYVGGPGQDRFALRRIGVLATDDLALFQQKVESAWPLRLKWWRRRLGKFARRYYPGATKSDRA